VNQNRTNGSITLGWPGDIGYLALEQSPTAGPASAWTSMTNVPIYSNNQWTEIFPATNVSAFFRLQAP